MSDSEKSDTDEEVIRYGTPLDPYEEDEVPTKKKYQEQSEQYAVDSHGRRRFHGAFTAGFSAGYGNTVGTPEGWTPTSFKSSRAEKASISSQKPEDFMDEEDRSEFGIAPRNVITQDSYSGTKRPKQQMYYDQTIPGEPVLQQLLRTVHETAAVKMLKAMGWKEGQGVGDRVTMAQKKKSKEQHKVYGCYIPPEMRQNLVRSSDEDSDDSEFDYNNLFAPDDYEPYVLKRKNDRFGLGYSGLSRHSVLGSMTGEYGGQSGTAKSHLLMNEKGKKVSIRGQAFGVSVLEAEDDDIYATEDMSHYDFAIGGAKEQKKTNVDKKPGEANVLPGFEKAKRGVPTPPSHPAPSLPRDYTPARRQTRFDSTTQESRDQGLGRHELSAKVRGEILGEKPLPEIPESITKQPEQKTDSNQDPIAKLLGRNVNFTTSDDSDQNKELDFISIKDSGKELTKVFKPFSSNPLKQKRYEKFLENKDSLLEGNSDMDKLSEWEREREMMEFEQAAKLYRPLTGVMADRFTHASKPDDGELNPLCAVAKSSTGYGLATPEQVEAANKGVYGVMTRRETSWRPEALVCKRFNVPVPGGSRQESKPEEKPKVSYSIFSYMETSVHDKDSFTKEQSKFSGSKSLENNKLYKETSDQIKVDLKKPESEKLNVDNDSGFGKRMTTVELFMKESQNEIENKTDGNEIINKFDKMDLYKSIFLSDSEDDDVPKSDGQNKEVFSNDFADTPKNIERNYSPPRGIFANIDFDELNSWKRRTDSIKTNLKQQANESEDSKLTTGQEDSGVYGPKLPSEIQKRLEVSDPEKKGTETIKHTFKSKDEREKLVVDSASSSDSWVDVNEIKSRIKKKKKRKSKHKKHKHKKKDR